MIATQQADARRYCAASLPDVLGLQRLDRLKPMAISGSVLTYVQKRLQ